MISAHPAGMQIPSLGPEQTHASIIIMQMEGKSKYHLHLIAVVNVCLTLLFQFSFSLDRSRSLSLSLSPPLVLRIAGACWHHRACVSLSHCAVVNLPQILTYVVFTDLPQSTDQRRFPFMVLKALRTVLGLVLFLSGQGQDDACHKVPPGPSWV